MEPIKYLFCPEFFLTELNNLRFKLARQKRKNINFPVTVKGQQEITLSF